MKARAAVLSAASSEPALKPNQPNQSRPAPSRVSGRLCGRIGSLPQPRRLPSTRASARPAEPALTWTTVPPAKSSMPRLLEPAAAPHPVRDGEVDERRPGDGEDRPGAELGPVGDRAADQRDGDDREGELEDREQQIRYAVHPSVGAHKPVLAQVGEPADEPVALCERQRVAVQDPRDRDGDDGDPAHHHHVQNALRPGHSSVEEGQAGVISRTSAVLASIHAVEPESIFTPVSFFPCCSKIHKRRCRDAHLRISWP